MKNPKDVYRELEKLKGDRGNWENLWQDVCDYVLPNKNDINSTKTPGQKRNLQIYDATGVQANELLAGSLHGMLTNPSTYWFELYTGIPELDRNDEVRKWLQAVAKRMHDTMNNSNFQTEIHEVYLDLGSIGTAVMSIDEDDTLVVCFKSHHISKVWIKEDTKGFVNKIYREFKWTPADIMAEFGETVPQWIKDKVDRDPDCEIEILNVVAPRENYDNKSIDPKAYKYSSCYYVKGEGKETLLKESGFRTMRYVSPRWTKGTGEQYGRSPSMKALPDIKMLNSMMKVIIRGAEKSVDPPLLVPDDSVLGTVRTTPGALNPYRAGTQDFIRPLDTGARLDLGYQMLEQIRNSIRDSYYIDQLQLREGPQKTATEVMQIREESLRFLGPMLGRQHSELLQPLIECVYEIMDRRKMFPPIPEAMRNAKASIRVQYRSMLAKAQLTMEANNIVRAFQAGAPFIQLEPESKDVIDCEEGLRYIANLYGLPVELIRDEDKIKDIREGRAEAQQKMIEQQQQSIAAENAGKVAPLLKATQSGS